MNGLLVIILLALSPFLCSGCTPFPIWCDQLMRDVVEGRWHANPNQIPAGSQGSKTVEFYDAAGRHVGYGVTSGSTMNVYGPDGSRVGYGRSGR